MKGYVAKVGRRKEKWVRVHLTAEESAGSRQKKRLLGSSSWYKGNQKMQSKNTTTTKGPMGGPPQGPLDRRMVTRAVLFEEQSPMGELARQYWNPS